MLVRNKKGELKEIIYDEKQLYNYGINRLSSRDYGRQELVIKMKRLQPDLNMINTVLDKLERQGYLSDLNRARSLFNQFEGRESINKTKNRIIQKGISKDIIEQVIESKEELKLEQDKDKDYDEETLSQEINNACELLIKKYKHYDLLKKEKMVRFLASKGYKYNDISKSIKTFSEIED